MAKAEKMNRQKKKNEGDTGMNIALLTTTPEMVVKKLDNGDIVAKDDAGMYVTKPHFVGSGLLDPYRSPKYRRQEYKEVQA